jgi:uncharacterized membrane protein
MAGVDLGRRLEKARLFWGWDWLFFAMAWVLQVAGVDLSRRLGKARRFWRWDQLFFAMGWALQVL